MHYCHIEKLNRPFALLNPKVQKLDCDAKMGDVFDNYILSSFGNSPLKSQIEFGQQDNGVRTCGQWVTLISLDEVEKICSNRKDLNLKDFVLYEDTAIFYPAIGFEMNGGELGAEILDDNPEKAIVKTYYYYIRK